MLARRLLSPHGRALRRQLCTTVKPLAGQVADLLAKTKHLEFKLDVLDKDEMKDLLLGLVKNNEITHDQVEARLPQYVVRSEPALDAPTVAIEGLRFEVGRTVECRMGLEEWARGQVVGHFYREEDWPEGQKAPYQVLLEGDDMTARTVWAPADNDECIRAAVRFPTGAQVYT